MQRKSKKTFMLSFERQKRFSNRILFGTKRGSSSNHYIIIKPGVAGAVLQTSPSLIHEFINWFIGNLVVPCPLGEKEKKQVGNIQLLPSRALSIHYCGLWMNFNVVYLKKRKTDNRLIIIERQRVNRTHTKSWYLLTAWQLIHYLV